MVARLALEDNIEDKLLSQRASKVHGLILLGHLNQIIYICVGRPYVQSMRRETDTEK
jgi:hypothetical protein